MDWNFLAQAVVTMLVITAPPDPAKILFFNSIVDQRGSSRTSAALRVALVVLSILGGASLVGGQLAELLGIDLNAFSVVGGLVVAGMGFEMLYGGETSKTQGQQTSREGPDADSGLIMPLSIPLIAGPGAIVAVVGIASSNDEYGIVAALIASASVALVAFIAFQFLGGLLAQMSPRTTALLLRIGGMLLATIGMQMLLGGLKNYFAS